MNKIEKGKAGLTAIGITILVLGVLALAGGIVLTILGVTLGKISVVMLVFGILLILLGLFGVCLGIYLTWIARALVATKGSIAEENLGKGTVGVKKCTNCGKILANDSTETICEKCKENLKP